MGILSADYREIGARRDRPHVPVSVLIRTIVLTTVIAEKTDSSYS
jgi:hypothetical protein